jgi:hypothetical protein
VTSTAAQMSECPVRESMGIRLHHRTQIVTEARLEIQGFFIKAI